MEGFEEYDKTRREKLVCKLKMVLEGGRQSGHLWQQANTGFLKSYGLASRSFGANRASSPSSATARLSSSLFGSTTSPLPTPTRTNNSSTSLQRPTASASRARSPL
eukprot:2732689-Pleurochrysis_carterae.AAC.1